MKTILDVERVSGVSKSTISRYLNGVKVNETNKKKIEEAIAQLDYRVNPMASGLKSNTTKVVGIVLPDITDPFFPPIVKQLERKLREQGYQTLFNNYGNDVEIEKQQVEVLINQRVDGLIIASSSHTGEHIQACIDREIPVVMMDRLIDGVDCDSVTVDNHEAIIYAMATAIRHGHRKIGIISGQKHVYSDKIRLNAYIDALQRHNIEIREDYMVRADITTHDANRQFMQLVNMDNPPTLIFCCNVYISAGAMEAMFINKLKIPDEISVMCFDRLSSFPYYSFLKSLQPEFASITQPLDEIANTTAKLLLERMQNNLECTPPRHVVLKTSFHMTNSIKDLTT